jgi:hypothetical protein
MITSIQQRRALRHVKINPKGLAVLSPPSPINPEVMRTIEMLSNEMWPGVPVIPIMGGGYTDSRWLRNAGIPSYGVAGLFVDPVTNGIHGLNEQVGVKELYDILGSPHNPKFLWVQVQKLSTGKFHDVSSKNIEDFKLGCSPPLAQRCR